MAKPVLVDFSPSAQQPDPFRDSERCRMLLTVLVDWLRGKTINARPDDAECALLLAETALGHATNAARSIDQALAGRKGS